MNFGLSGPSGRFYPSLSQIITTGEVKELRPHQKFLTGDYLTYMKGIIKKEILFAIASDYKLINFPYFDHLFCIQQKKRENVERNK